MSHLHVGTGALSFPMRKQEGYADYVSSVSEHISGLQDRIRAVGDFSQFSTDESMTYACVDRGVVAQSDGTEWPACYFTARVVWECLRQMKGMPTDEIILDDAPFRFWRAQMLQSLE